MTWSSDCYELPGLRTQCRQTILSGMKAICDHVGKSETTVRKLIREEGLPAAKEGGEWLSDEQLIYDWRIKRMKEESERRIQALKTVNDR